MIGSYTIHMALSFNPSNFFFCIFLEKRLHHLGLLSSHAKEQSYFIKDLNMGPVEDDHLPFLQRGRTKCPS